MHAPLAPANRDLAETALPPLVAEDEHGDDQLVTVVSLNRAQRRALVRSMPKIHAPIRRAMRGIKSSADAVALAKSRGL